MRAAPVVWRGKPSTKIQYTATATPIVGCLYVCMVLSSVGPRAATGGRQKSEYVELHDEFATVTAQRCNTVTSIE